MGHCQLAQGVSNRYTCAHINFLMRFAFFLPALSPCCLLLLCLMTRRSALTVTSCGVVFYSNALCNLDARDEIHSLHPPLSRSRAHSLDAYDMHQPSTSRVRQTSGWSAPLFSTRTQHNVYLQMVFNLLRTTSEPARFETDLLYERHAVIRTLWDAMPLNKFYEIKKNL